MNNKNWLVLGVVVLVALGVWFYVDSRDKVDASPSINKEVCESQRSAFIDSYLENKQLSYKVLREDCDIARLEGLPSTSNIDAPSTYTIGGIPYHSQESKITGFSAAVKMILDLIHPENQVTQSQLTENMIGDIWQEKTQTYDYAYLSRKHGRESIVEQLHEQGIYASVYFPAQYMYGYFGEDLEKAREYLRDCGDDLEFTNQFEEYLKDILSHGDPAIYRDRVNFVGEYNVNEKMDTSEKRYIYSDNPRTDLKYKETMDVIGQAVLVYGYNRDGFLISNPWAGEGERSGQYVQEHLDNMVDACLDYVVFIDAEILSPLNHPREAIQINNEFYLDFKVENHKHEAMMNQFPIRNAKVEVISEGFIADSVSLGTVEMGYSEEHSMRIIPSLSGSQVLKLRFSGEVSSFREGDVPYVDLDLPKYTHKIWYDQEIIININA
jgi:hypothetical protein